MQNKVKIPMKEILSEQVEKIEGKRGGWFYLVKVVVEPHEGFSDRVEWWKVFRSNGPFERRFVTHAPTKELALQGIENLNNSKWHSYATVRWMAPDLSAEDEAKLEKATVSKTVKVTSNKNFCDSILGR